MVILNVIWSTVIDLFEHAFNLINLRLFIGFKVVLLYIHTRLMLFLFLSNSIRYLGLINLMALNLLFIGPIHWHLSLDLYILKIIIDNFIMLNEITDV